MKTTTDAAEVHPADRIEAGTLLRSRDESFSNASGTARMVQPPEYHDTIIKGG